MLLDRRAERAALDGLLKSARGGRSATLVLRGAPGVGKTALLEYASESASDMRVVRAVGAEPERELPFAALHQLCAPVLDWLERLPAPQRDALATTFGLSAGPAPDPFLVGLAGLSLLAEAAEDRPILSVVDDSQWLDHASARALGFIARRLLAEPVAMLFAARTPGEAFERLPELVVDGLQNADARALLVSGLPWPLDERVRDQIVRETGGNPLALLELPRALSPAELAGGFGVPGAASLSDRIEESFLARLEVLPEDTRRLVFVAAAEPTGDPALLWRAAGRLGIARTAFEPAEQAGLLEVGAAVRFRHPLVRSATYRAASRRQRQEVHGALADATDAETEPDRRAWHLAEAAAGPDEEVAAELERSAGRAQARGGLAAAATFLERATALTPDPAARSRRALATAQTKLEAGFLEDALALLATAEANDLDDLQRARTHQLRAQVAFASRRGNDAPPLLLRAAQELETVDADLARPAYLEALSAAMFAGRLARNVGVVEVSQAARAGLASAQPLGPSDLLLQGLAVRLSEGYEAGAPILKKALSAFRSEIALPLQEARWLWLACWAASDLWDDEAWTLLSTRQLELTRAAGALTAIPFVLSALSCLEALRGELAAATTHVDEIRAVTEATGIDTPPYGALWLAAVQGHDAEAVELIDATAGEAASRGEGYALSVTEWVTAILHNGLARHDVVINSLHRGGRPFDDLGWTHALSELIEAAVRGGQLGLAREALDEFAPTARAAGTHWALGVEARSRALLSEGPPAEALYQDAIERLQRTRVPLDVARAHLLYGEWLRREERRADCRAQLRTAREMFSAMGADAFARRAERELLATGERFRRRRVETSEGLTDQEARIAALARDGLSNTEIGTRLFISPRTAEYHLGKVFTKLGIKSRGELDRVLSRVTDLAATP
jgi:DNA-binding CsgD family transcriptional regulator